MGKKNRVGDDLLSGTRRVRVEPDCPHWDAAQSFCSLFNTLLKHHLDSPPIAPVRLLKLYETACAGLNYYMTFRVIAENGYTVDYNAKVWRKVCKQGMELLSLEKVAEKKTTGIEIPDDNNEGATKLFAGQDCCRVSTTAFFVFLKHFRTERPKLKFAKAKKAAATAWRKLSETEKMEFIRQAAKN